MLFDGLWRRYIGVRPFNTMNKSKRKVNRKNGVEVSCHESIGWSVVDVLGTFDSLAFVVIRFSTFIPAVSYAYSIDSKRLLMTLLAISQWVLKKLPLYVH